MQVKKKAGRGCTKQLITDSPCNRSRSSPSSLDETTEAQRGEVTCLRPHSCGRQSRHEDQELPHPKCSASLNPLLFGSLNSLPGAETLKAQMPKPQHTHRSISQLAKVNRSHLSLSTCYVLQALAKTVHGYFHSSSPQHRRVASMIVCFTDEGPETQRG